MLALTRTGRHLAALTLLLIVATSSLLGAQTRIAGQHPAPGAATLGGIVADESGAVIGRVELTLADAVTGVQRTTVTDDRGAYSFAGVPPGTYVLTAGHGGFAPLRIEDIVLADGAERSLPVTLRVGSLDERVSVVTATLAAGGQAARVGRVGLLGGRDIFDTPFNITHFTARTLEDQQAHSVGDVLANDPSVRTVYARGANTDEFVVRGFTLYNREVSFNGLFGILPFSTISVEGLERVEVLKGPNALLNGMSPSGSIGGGINLVPKRAGERLIVKPTIAYTSDSQASVHLDVGRRFGPIGVRVNGVYRTGETPIDGNDQQLRYVTAGVDYTNTRVRLDADVAYQDRDVDAPMGLLFPGTVVPAVAAPKATGNYYQPWTYATEDNTFVAAHGEVAITDRVTAFANAGVRSGRTASLQTNWTLQDAAGTLRSTPFWNDTTNDVITGDGGVRGRVRTGPLLHELVASANAYAQESGTLGGSIAPAIFSNLYAPVVNPAPVMPDWGIVIKPSTLDLSSVAVADTMTTLRDRLLVTVGVRRQAIDVENYNALTGAATSRYDDSRVTPLIAVVFKPRARVSIYGNYVEGLTQGPTAPTSAVNAGEIFPPFVSKQYEGGVKIDLGRLTVTANGFQIDQPSSFTDPATLIFVVDGEQRHRGLEVNTLGELARGLRVLGGLAYTDAVLTHTAGGVNDGRTGIGVPAWQFNLGAEWDTPFLRDLTVTGRVISTSAQYLNAPNTQQIPDWTRLDAGVRYIVLAGGVPVTLRASLENLLGNDYWVSASRGGYKLGGARTVLLSSTVSF